jgi:DNA-binding response OmpR family regulator
VARILVVEDEPTIALGLQDDLTLEGHTVDVVTDGVSAEQRVMERCHDLILLDIMLPGRDGFSICRAVRAAGIATPIIVLTARGQELDKVRGLQLGADDYVTKPFSPLELLARVQSVLRRSQTSSTVAPRIYCVGDLTLDFVRHEASRNGTRIDLTATEFKLLRTFVRHRGQVLTLDRLLAEVWGPDIFLTDRVIYTHVSNLRQKIEIDSTRPTLIVGVRGVGYRFDG